MRENWFIAARRDQVRGRPLRRVILERPLVLFRDSMGRIAVLEDRCPHKHVALSLGRVVGDAIESISRPVLRRRRALHRLLRACDCFAHGPRLLNGCQWLKVWAC